MKEVIYNLILFAVFAVVFSGLSACTSTAGSESGPVDVNAPATSPDSPAGGDVVKKKSDYPPIASAVATAEIKKLDGTAFTVNDKKGNVNKLTLGAAKKPPHVNLLRQGLKEESLGIYELKGDRLKLCYGEPGKGRPEEFESKEGGRVFLIVLQRVKKE